MKTIDPAQMSTPKTAPDFGEPWTRSFTNAFKINTGELRHFECGWRDRAISCVNACAGMSDPAAEIQALREAVKEAGDAFEDLISLLPDVPPWAHTEATLALSKLQSLA